MLMAEARWVGQALSRLKFDDISPLLNVGSSSAAFREQVQPYIDHEIFVPLRKRAVVVDHLDVQEGEGIDLHGDMADAAFVAGLGSRGYQALLCCNLLEHVTNPALICAKLELLVPVGGYLVVTIPRRFPYHPDPIDTRFRPELAELTALFPRCCLVDGTVLACGTGWDYVGRDPRVLINKVKSRLFGNQNHGGVKGSASFLPWLFRQFRQTCALLQRKPDAI